MDNEHQAHWEQRYTEKPRIWSGRVNAQLAEIAPQLDCGVALDLGCGEGGDAIWLAEHGWQVVAVDVSATALARAAEEAGKRGVLSHIDFQQHDLTQTLPAGPFNLVSAQFFHSLVEMDRPAILRRAAATVAPGGTLLIVDHGGMPPWAPEEVHHHVFESPHEVIDGLALDPARWETTRVGPVPREAVGPDGEQTTLVDNVIQLRRR
ncbi:class I SAM-dependent methyltransferase [Mycobacterium sp. NBC_00419]|uniref:class I SAM-dependent methyltransferase n=1 Tax=Mycobacterium sp. NBC_00419 TaxID=2975989 RepID=UPI002E1C774D